MTRRLQKVRYFAMTCEACGCAFDSPDLGDFSYGSFLLHAEGVVAHLHAFDEPAWEDIETHLCEQNLFRSERSTAEIRRFQSVVSAAADPVDGKRLTPTRLCPQCHSRQLSLSSIPTRDGEIPVVAFDAYSALRGEQRDEMVARLWHELPADAEGS